MVAIIDYGVGNLFSLKSSLALIGKAAVVTGDRELIRNADHVILPGVGAFGDAVKKLRESGLFDVVKEIAAEGKPLLGICLGMQLLFDRSTEYGEHEGLGLISGEVRSIEPVLPEGSDVPHMGWNSLTFWNSCPIFRDLKEGEFVYFVHSYAAFDCEKSLAAMTEYHGIPLTAAVCRGNVFGCQFHPEKSGEVGLKILKAFCEI